MREGPLSHEYIKVGDRIGLMVKRDISPDQMTETGAMAQTAIPDGIIKVIDLGENFRGNSRQSSREGYRNERYGNKNHRDRNRSRERTFVEN